MKELIEELKLNRVAYLLEIMEKKDFDSKINALKKLEKMKTFLAHLKIIMDLFLL